MPTGGGGRKKNGRIIDWRFSTRTQNNYGLCKS